MKKITILSVCLIALSGLIVVAGHSTKSKEKEVVQIGLDYKTYSSLETLKSDADVIVRGEVLGSRVISEPHPTNAHKVDTSIPALPRTLTNVRIVETVFGKTNKATITVSQIGGELNDADYRVEDLQPLEQGEIVVLFLKKGSRGIYYPLAGGTAVATEAQTGIYELPKSVSKTQGFHFNSKAEELQ